MKTIVGKHTDTQRYKEADKTHGGKYNMGQQQKKQYGTKEEHTCIVFSAFGLYCNFCFSSILYCISETTGTTNPLFFQLPCKVGTHRPTHTHKRSPVSMISGLKYAAGIQNQIPRFLGGRPNLSTDLPLQSKNMCGLLRYIPNGESPTLAGGTNSVGNSQRKM